MVLPDLRMHRASVFRAGGGTLVRGRGGRLWRNGQLLHGRGVDMFSRVSAAVMALMMGMYRRWVPMA